MTWDPIEAARIAAELRSPSAAESRSPVLARCGDCLGEGVAKLSGPISGEWTEECEKCLGTGLALVVIRTAAADHLEAAAAEIQALRAQLAEARVGADVVRGLRLIVGHLDDGGHDWRSGSDRQDVEAARRFFDARGQAGPHDFRPL